MGQACSEWDRGTSREECLLLKEDAACGGKGQGHIWSQIFYEVGRPHPQTALGRALQKASQEGVMAKASVGNKEPCIKPRRRARQKEGSARAKRRGQGPSRFRHFRSPVYVRPFTEPERTLSSPPVI